MPWNFACPECHRQLQKDYAQEQWRCACGWVGGQPEADQPKPGERP